MSEPNVSTAFTPAKGELASQVRRFEQLVAEHSDRLRRIELLLDEIAADDVPVGRADEPPRARMVT